MIILILFSWICVTCVSCFDWTKLWLSVILFKTVLIILFWYPLSFFNACVILVFSLLKSSSLVMMEYTGENFNAGIGHYVYIYIVYIYIFFVREPFFCLSLLTFISLFSLIFYFIRFNTINKQHFLNNGDRKEF